MENKKLLKFLYKDIAEIEELFVDKGSEGFDEYEIEFIQSRFKGAKQVIQILSEKENKQLKNIRPRPAVLVEESIQLQSQLTEKEESIQSQLQLTETEEEESDPLQSQSQAQISGEDAREQSSVSADEEERLQALSKFEEEVKESDQSQLSEKSEQSQSQLTEKKVGESIQSQSQSQMAEKEEESLPLQDIEETEEDLQQKESDVELDDEEEEVGNANHRLGDSFLKEKSVNELLAGDDSGKLEYKISNSPVASLKAAIGINDRYQYIRELFEGNGDKFTKAVSDLDNLNSIQEAVSYLQQNYKWKKNETSLKFVTLVKRRFPNG